MSFMTAPPPSAGGIPFNEHLNALLLIDVKEYVTGVETVHGVSDAVRADINVIDGPGAPATYSDTLVFPKVLRGQLRNGIGQQVLGRLTQGERKPGKNPAWILDAATPADVTTAEAWVKANTANAFASPGTATEAPPF